MLSAIAKVFGDAGGIGGALHSQQRRDIRRGGDHHRTRATVGAENIFDKIFNFAATFADKSHDNHVRPRVARHHAKQNRFTNAGTGKESHTLTAPYG